MRLESLTALSVADTDGVSPNGTHLDGYSSAASFTSAALFVGASRALLLSILAIGTAVGTVKLQACNDASNTTSGPERPSSALANWYDLTFTGAVSGDTLVNFSDPDCTYRWVRVVYTRTSGTSTFTVRAQQKGIS